MTLALLPLVGVLPSQCPGLKCPDKAARQGARGGQEEEAQCPSPGPGEGERGETAAHRTGEGGASRVSWTERLRIVSACVVSSEQGAVRAPPVCGLATPEALGSSLMVPWLLTDAPSLWT